jgi:hypothetical protein
VTLGRFSDLEEALSAPDGRAGCERRIHFHVPLFTSEYDGLGSSQNVVRAVLDEVRRGDVTQHLEIEKYTWSVLPEALKMEIGASLAREYEWVINAWSR